MPPDARVRSGKREPDHPYRVMTWPGPPANFRFVETHAQEQSLFVDARVASLLLADARQRAVTRVFGLPRGDQSVLVTLILAGAAVTVVREFMPRPWSSLSRENAAIGGLVLNTALGSIGRAPTREIPLAGALIGFALVAHSLRPVVAGSVREVRAFTHGARATLHYQYAKATRGNMGAARVEPATPRG